ncbi:helix-turn-helix domain-containing protein [Kutzneria buriramensis]|uniref:Helix-turn-helix protein n=1 Tax=Kutzneria buriramensis TaxID=1045776 RepID=A0A3E0G5A6_9PSEU|nr:helix-turn-helix transcriptional regulator [Kutzneria buriramensis]REH17935.1 helix-turn-helix protein [Kutzneria buriramensis]
MSRNEELSDFLRARRAAIDPRSLGIIDDQARRVPGLRREELARLAGVSVDYYTRLEQGRPITPSDSVLDAIATALQLDATERTYLHTVSRPQTSSRRRTTRAGQAVRRGQLELLEALGDTPAFILGRRTDILAANRMARAVLADFTAMPARQRNAARWILLDEAARSLYGDGWAKVGSEVVGTLRMDAARHPDDPRTAELVGELSMRSEHFRRWWADQKVVEWTYDEKILHHPIAGTLTLATEAVTFPADPDQIMFTLLPKPGSPTQQALTMLSAWLEQHDPDDEPSAQAPRS